MRTLLTSLGRIRCRCQCYSCLDLRHFEVRRRLTTLALLRSGRVSWHQIWTRALSSQRDNYQSPAGLKEKEPKKHWSRAWDDRVGPGKDEPGKSETAWDSEARGISTEFGVDPLRENVDKPTGKGFEKNEEPKKHWSRAWDDGLGTSKDEPETEEMTWDPKAENTVKEHEVDSFPENTDIPTKEELKDMAVRLKSISIDHWSLRDLARYEPRPGGEKPPTAPSTSRADPNLMPPQSPWASDSLKRLAYSSVWAPKKIQRMEIAVAIFTLQMCRTFKLYNQRPSNLLVLPEAIRPIAKLSRERQDKILLKLQDRKRLLRARYGSAMFIEFDQTLPSPLNVEEDFIPSYMHLEGGLHNEYIYDLNQYLAALFDGYKNREIDMRSLILKICHNLLVSAAPPNVQTLNILLHGFYTADQGKRKFALVFQIMDHLVANLCLFAMIRPNEITCSAILKSYRVRRMPRAFAHYLGLMRGTEEKALMYTTNLKLTSASAPRLTPTLYQPRRFKQAVYPSTLVMSEIIKGITTFFCLEDAMETCKQLVDKEWGYDWSCLNYMLLAALAQRNWEVGWWVWGEIKAFGSLGEQEPVSVLSGVLALCVQAEKPDEFAEALEYTMGRHPSRGTSYFVKIAARILEDTANRMSDKLLLASVTELDVAKWRDEVRVHDERVVRRLDDDPEFKNHVLGYASSATEQTRRQHGELVEEDPEPGHETVDETAGASSDSVWPEFGDQVDVAWGLDFAATPPSKKKMPESYLKE